MNSCSESVRERDLHRYYQPWLDGRDHIVSTDERAKRLIPQVYHKALTAFAQLGALRLDVRRAMVSLIDSSHQYVLAEATKTLSIISRNSEQPEDEMWLGNTTIARCDSVCQYTFSSKYVVRNGEGDEYTVDCMVVPDCRQDPRFSEREFVKGQHGVRFYAGVPITTKAGHQIGAYAIYDDRPRDALCASDVHFMQDIAVAIMEHLELAKDSGDREKGEQMIHGLTEFIERSSLQEPQKPTYHRLTTMEKQTENARSEISEETFGVNAETAASDGRTERKRKPDEETDSSRVFHRAARIIRQSTRADGVVFFDIAAAGIKGHVYENVSQVASSEESQTLTGTDFDTADSCRDSRERLSHDPMSLALDCGSNEGVPLHSCASEGVDSRFCPVTGLCLRMGTAQQSEQDFCVTEACLERCIRRYPYGRFFNFNDDGLNIDSNGERSENTETDQSDHHARLGLSMRKRRKRGNRRIPEQLLKVLPSVRTLIFLPIWDPTSERWIAGGFIWTNTPDRLLSPENDLPYLKAFGNCITSQIARMNAQKSDRAKSTFIASISHELRSPLHGILGSVELLHDAVSTSDQRSLASSIEICGKTLLDTIDHVLDYAKINKLHRANTHRRQQAEGRQKKLPNDNSILGIISDFNLSQLVEEVCETVCAGHSFRQAHMARSGAFHGRIDLPTADIPQESVETTENNTDNSHRHELGVTLSFDPFGNWIVRSQPGALRRIVMNLLGNALKYTESGFINVALLQSSSTSHSVDLTIRVEDSGKGMSVEFQRTKLFAPFSQEDPFSNGTGLGLSIIKQIVDSLGGDIEIQSTVDVGTSVNVSLKLPAGRKEDARTSQTLLQAPDALKHTTACIVTKTDVAGQKLRNSMESACYGFSIKVSETSDLSIAKPDFLITEPMCLDHILKEQIEAKSRTRPLTVICICTNQAAKGEVESRIKRQVTAMGWIADVTTQPCGPRKLATKLLDCQKRALNTRSERLLPRSISDQSHLSTRPTLPGRLRDDKIHRNSIDVAMRRGSATGAPSATGSPPLSNSVSTTRSTINSSSSSQSFDHMQGIDTTSETEKDSVPRVLLVDDNPINLKLLTLFAQRQNLLYTCATNGLEAFNTFKSNASSSSSSVSSVSSPSSSSSQTIPSAKLSKPFDYILMDISMPVMDGMEATRQIRQFEAKNGIERSTIAALTGLASEKDQKEARDAGVDMYLVKPVKFDDIRRCFEVK